MWLCFTNNVYIFCFPHTKTQSDFQRKANPPSPKSLAKRFCRLVWSKNISPWSCCGQVGMDWTICWVGVFPTASSMDGSLTLWSSKAFLFRAAEGHKQEQGWLRISCWCKQTILEMLFKSVWLQPDQHHRLVGIQKNIVLMALKSVAVGDPSAFLTAPLNQGSLESGLHAILPRFGQPCFRES